MSERNYFPSRIIRRWQWWVSIPVVVTIASPYILAECLRIFGESLVELSERAIYRLEDSRLHKVLLRVRGFALGQEHNHD